MFSVNALGMDFSKAEYNFTLSLRERVGVRGKALVIPEYLFIYATSNGIH